MPEAITLALNETEKIATLTGATSVEDGSNTRTTVHGLSEAEFNDAFHVLIGVGTHHLSGVSHNDVELETASLVVVPEPASLARLGLGGLAMLCRRRK